MANNYDGYITIGTKIDTSGITGEISSLKRSVSNEMAGIEKSLNSSMSKLENGVSKTFSLIKTTIVGVGLAFVFKEITKNLDSAISRLDTLSNYTKVMSNLGINAKDADESIKYLSDKLTGLPTTLDDAVASVQRFTSANNNVKASTQMFLALNNAILAGGASTQVQSSALEQLSQAYSKGKPDMMEWRTAMMAMPAQLKQVAISMGYINVDQLGEALRKGTVSMNDFMKEIVKLNTEGANGFASFEEQAKNATGGIATSMTNVKTAITRGLAQIMEAIGQSNIAGFFQGIARAINNVIPYIVSFVKILVTAVSYISSLFRGTKKDVDNVNVSVGGASGSMDNLSDSAYDTSKGLDKATGSAKKLNEELKNTASFDELNILKDTSSSGGGESSSGGGSSLGDLDLSGFDFENTLEEKVDKLNELIKRINLEPLKKSVENMVEAIKYFKQGTFKILEVFLNDYIKPLASYVISDALPHFLNSTADAMKKVDFDKIAKSFSKFLKALEPITEKIGDVLLWLYDEVLIPISLWTVNDVLPVFLDSLASVLKILNRVIEDFQPYFNWLWEKALKPLAKFEGGMIVKILQAIAKALDWIASNDYAIKVLENLFSNLVHLIASITGFTEVISLNIIATENQNKATIDLKDAQEKLKRATDDLSDANDDYIYSVDRATEAEKKLKEAEDRTKLSGEELNRMVENGILDYKNMTTEQREVYKAYIDNDNAQKRVKDSAEKLTQAKKNEKQASFENQLQVLREGNQYDEYKRKVVEAFNNSEISAQQASNYISYAMRSMSDESKKTYTYDLPNSIKDGLNTNNYSYDISRFKNWWNNFLANLTKELKLKISAVGNFSISGGYGAGGGGAGGRNALGAIYIPHIPLATGGIINMPGRGLPLGSAVGGERGAEGVIPLTQQQAMSELGYEIGKNVTVNLTNITEMNGRIINRELKRVQSQQDFAYNN